MKRILLGLLILLAAFGVYWIFLKDKSVELKEAKVAALNVGNHSTDFNKGIDSMMNAYFDVKAAFVDADTARAKAAAQKLILLADSSKLSELKKDTSGIYQSAVMQMIDVKLNAGSLVNQQNITEMRQDFRMISESIYPLLKTIRYEGKVLYWQNCPMAFGEDKGANWVSNTSQIINPYLGKNHPEYKGAMLHCGEVKDSIKAR